MAVRDRLPRPAPRSGVLEIDAPVSEEDLRRLVGCRWVAELVVEGSLPAPALDGVVRAGRQAGRRVRVLGGLPEGELPVVPAGERWRYDAFGHRPGWLLVGRAPSRWQVAIKRAADIIVAGIAAVALSPVLVATAIAVYLSSPGPILYAWRVVGRNGRPFTGYKFRTMIQNADALKPGLLERNEMVGPVFKVGDDPRLTGVGGWLRRYSLDELPQLWNVVRGEMSLVGPRPPLREEYERFELWQMRKLSVTPGLTCLWQVKGRNAIRDFADWARLDLQYIDRWSLWLDFRILVQTIPAVIGGTGH